MPIKKYVDSVTGKKMWSVRVTASSSDKKIRLEKKKIGIEDRPEAKKLETKLKNELVREITIKEGHGTIWKKITDGFIDAMYTGKGLDNQLQDSSIEDYRSLIKVYTSQWDRLPITQISRVDIKRTIDLMEQEGLSSHRRRKLKSIINRIFEWSIFMDKIPANIISPALGVKTGKAEEKKPDILTLTEIQKLLDMAQYYKHEWCPIWATALLSGMRSGELYALKWNSVNFENKIISVTESYDKRNRKFKSTKGGYWRDVPINTALEMLFKELRKQTMHTGFVLPRIQDWDRGEQARILRSFCEEIGIKSVKFHALRACFATQLLRDKIAPVVVMKICGWKDLKTMQRYVRLAGIEIVGATDGLKFLSTQEAAERILDLYKKDNVGLEWKNTVNGGCA